MALKWERNSDGGISAEFEAASVGGRFKMKIFAFDNGRKMYGLELIQPDEPNINLGDYSTRSQAKKAVEAIVALVD